METATTGSLGKFLDPDAIIVQLNLSQDSVVADFGCGPGYFSIPFAKAVGEGGKVYSFDILPQALESIAGKIKNSGIANIVTKRANLEREKGSGLMPETIDWVILKDVLFQNQNKSAMIHEANRVLKPEGKLLIIEWNQKDAGIGPEMNLRIKKDEMEKMLSDQNFAIEKEIQAGDFHYSLVATKKVSH